MSETKQLLNLLLKVLAILLFLVALEQLGDSLEEIRASGGNQ